MIKPVWLLDVDGVINVGYRGMKRPPRVWPADAWVEFDATDENTDSTWPMRIARPVADFIFEVINTELADVRWHTTWQHSANVIGAVMGLPTLPVANAPEFSDRDSLNGEWWKLGAARRVREIEDHPVLWTDDDAGICLTGETRRHFFEWPNLVVSPSSSQGLIPRDLRRIREYLETWKEKNDADDGDDLAVLRG